MSVLEIQRQLIRRMSNVKDADVLRMLDEELSFSLESHKDLSKILSEQVFNELPILANEPPEKDTIALTEFNKIMDQWRMK